MTKDNAIAAHADEVKDKVLATATVATEKATEAVQKGAAVATEKATEAVRTVADKLPASQQEWEQLAAGVTDRIRKNPRPWVIGAGIAVVFFLLGRRRSR